MTLSIDSRAAQVASRFVAAVLLLGVAAGQCEADDWLRFRGPGGAAFSDDTGTPVTWDGERNIAWKTRLPGPGGSSPVVVGRRVFVTAYTGYGLDKENPGQQSNLRRVLVCLDRDTGQVLWTREVPANGEEVNYQDFITEHGYATHTPTSDGERVFAFFGTCGVRAFDLDGKPAWSAELGSGANYWGSAASPIVVGDLLVINAAIECERLVALDRRTGLERWRSQRIFSSWSTPVLAQAPGDKPELVLNVKDRMLGFDPASGEQLWTFTTRQAFGAPSPIAHEGRIYSYVSHPNALVAMRPGGQGDVTKTHLIWKAERIGSSVTSPVLYQGRLYGIDRQGIVGCVDAATGKVLYRQRLQAENAKFYASPVAADGKIYFVSREHGVYVVAAGPKFSVLAVNRFGADTSVCNATPAIHDGQLLLRSNRFLYCLGK